MAARCFCLLIVLLGAGCSGASGGHAAAGGQCRSNGDCTGGLICVTGVCRVAGNVPEGQACVATRDCSTGLYCAPTGTCATAGVGQSGASCTLDAQCQPPLRCALSGFYGACVAPGSTDVGEQCQAHADCLSGLWCAPDGTCQTLARGFPGYAGVACEDSGSFRAYFEVPRPGAPLADFFRLPFPNDVRVSGGQLDLSDFPRPGGGVTGTDLVDLWADTWTADFEGFSVAATVTFRFSGEVDFATTTGTSVRFLDVTPGPSLGAEMGREWLWVGARNRYACRNRLIVRNAREAPLEAGHTYAVLLTTDIKSVAGQAAAPDADLVAVLGATRPSSDEALGRAWDAHQRLRDFLDGAGANAPTVAAAAVFTVADSAAHMARVATSVAAQPAPAITDLTLCGPGAASPCDDATVARTCTTTSAAFHELQGRLRVPVFQQGTAPYTTPAEGGAIVETGTAAVVQRTEDVCFSLTIPKTGTMPAGGWPLVVFHHDTAGSMRSFITAGVAEALSAGTPAVAVIGFDAVLHGARRGSLTRGSDELIWNLSNPRAMRDAILQGAADIQQVLRLSAAVDLGASASPTGAAVRFDPAAVAFFGHGQGSTSGVAALASSGVAGAAVFAGLGALYGAWLPARKSPFDLGAALAFHLGEAVDENHPVALLFQGVLDRADPIAHAPRVLWAPPEGGVEKHALVVSGDEDTFTPLAVQQIGARAMRLPLEGTGTGSATRPISGNITTLGGATRTGAEVSYTPSGYDGHQVAFRAAGAVADWTAFLSSGFASGTPSVP